jgi:hypothetical protein
MMRPEAEAVRTTTKSRKTVPLPEGLERRLFNYALAAGAAGVGLLAMAPPANANIIFTTAFDTTLGNGSSLAMDLNADGSTDLTLNDTSIRTFTFASFDRKYAFLEASGAVAGQLSHYGYNFLASALNAGHLIGPSLQFHASGLRDELVYGFTSLVLNYTGGKGNWRKVGSNVDKDLGFRFTAADGVHYGWAELDVTDSGAHITAQLKGVAYESCAGQSITAGATSGGASCAPPPAPEPGPATLTLLAMGWAGLGFWRKKKAEAINQ